VSSNELRDEVLNSLKEALVVKCEVDASALAPGTKLADELGLDSLDVMSAMMVIEDEYQIEIQDEELLDVLTLDDAVDLLVKKVSARATA
jgi:acyl carrier protein